MKVDRYFGQAASIALSFAGAFGAFSVDAAHGNAASGGDSRPLVPAAVVFMTDAALKRLQQDDARERRHRAEVEPPRRAAAAISATIVPA
jgi:hypothetical protein